MPNNSDLLPSIIAIAQSAGNAILPFYQSKQLDVSRKSNNTVVTQADIAAHQVITHEIGKLSDLPILSEEGEIPSYEIRRQWSRYWLLDPLDGTRGFINGLDEFSVNIALIDNHQPVLGVIYAPIHQSLFFASRGAGAFQRNKEGLTKPLAAEKRAFDSLRFIVGKYHQLRRIQLVLDAIPRAELLRLNSSLKFAVIAQGKADVYARLGPINEWDIAAGQCILEEAGGKLVDFKGNSLQYNAGQSLLCPPFIAVGDSRHIDPLIHLFEKGSRGVSTS